MFCYHTIVSSLILDVANSKWEPISENDTIWSILIESGPFCKNAYKAVIDGTIYILGISKEEGVVLFVIEPFAISIKCIRSSYLLCKLHKAIVEYSGKGIYEITDEDLDILPLVKKLSRLSMSTTELTKCKVFEQLPDANRYAIYSISVQKKLVACYAAYGDCTGVYIYDSAHCWYSKVNNKAAFDYFTRRFAEVISRDVDAEKREESILYNFLSVYAPEAIYKISGLRLSHPDLTLYELSELIKEEGGN